MTFLQLWDDALDIELASADQTVLFTAAVRKKAINDAQDDFARITGATKRYGSINISTGVAEYDLEASFTDFIRLAGNPSIKIVSASSTQYIQGEDLPHRDPEELDVIEAGWRSASNGTPASWYLREDGGATWLGMTPPPNVVAGQTWTWIVPYVADPPDMVATTDVPFTFASNPIARLIPYHQALVHKAAALLEPLRKNYSGVDRQTKLYSGWIAQYLQTQTEQGRDQVRLIRNYLGEGHRGSRARDPRSWP